MLTPPLDRIKGTKVNFMLTCLCDAIFDDAAICAVELLKTFGATIIFPEAQTCCGQPAFNSGDFESARKVIRHTMKVFSENNYPIVVPSASCAAMLFGSINTAFADCSEAERKAAEDFSKRIWEFCDYLKNVLNADLFNASLSVKIVMHNSCHSRNTPTPEAASALLKSVKGLEIKDFDGAQDCCGFGGTFSVVFPQLSSELGVAKVNAIAKLAPDFIVAADTSCLLHQKGIAEKLGITYNVKHIAQILHLALKTGGRTNG